MHLLLFEIYKRRLSIVGAWHNPNILLLEHGTIQTFYPVYDLWSGFLYYNLIILHRESIPYPSPRYFLGRFVGQLSKHTGQLCGSSSWNALGSSVGQVLVSALVPRTPFSVSLKRVYFMIQTSYFLISTTASRSYTFDIKFCANLNFFLIHLLVLPLNICSSCH